MSKICQFCGKVAQKNNMVARGIGNRCAKRTISRKKVNLRSKRLSIGSSTIKVILCASCLKRIKRESVQTPVEVSKKTA